MASRSDDARVSVRVTYETHSISVDNERGFATGWLHGQLSTAGKALAREVGERRASGYDAVFTSDLGRAVETAEIAFEGRGVPILKDWRLRETNYGERNGMPVSELRAETMSHIDDPWPGGESYEQAVQRVGWFFEDLLRGWDATRVVVIGHAVTRVALECRTTGWSVAEVMRTPWEWRPGWEYVIDAVRGALRGS